MSKAAVVMLTSANEIAKKSMHNDEKKTQRESRA